MRRYLLIITLGWMIPAVALAIVNWVIDPYRIFHQPWLQENYYVSDHIMRETAAGIINTEDFDGVILGTSMAQNLSPNEASRLLGGKFVNISLSGSSIPERAIVLNYAASKRKLKKVVFSLDWYLISTRAEESPIAQYTYLYDESRVNDFLIYMSSLKPLRYVFCRNVLFAGDQLCKHARNDLETLVEWHSSPENSRLFGGFDKWLEATGDIKIRHALQGIAQNIKKLEQNKIGSVDPNRAKRNAAYLRGIFRDTMLKIVAQHPDTQFYFYFPPYSRLNYALLKQTDPQGFADYMNVLRFVTNDGAQYPNVKVFGFDTESFLDDIANYKDTSHYHQRIDSKILAWMSMNQYVLAPSTVENYIKLASDLAGRYPLKHFGDEIDAHLARQHP